MAIAMAVRVGLQAVPVGMTPQVATKVDVVKTPYFRVRVHYTVLITFSHATCPLKKK